MHTHLDHSSLCLISSLLSLSSSLSRCLCLFAVLLSARHSNHDPASDSHTLSHDNLAGGGRGGGEVQGPGQQSGASFDYAMIANLIVDKLKDLGIVSRVAKTEKMSGVSEGLAENLLRSLGIKIERGDTLLTCQDNIKFTSFDMSSYKDEKDATLPYLAYLKKSLTTFQVNMTEYDVVDLRSKPLVFKSDDLDLKFRGFLDIGIVCAGSESFLEDMVVAVELKYAGKAGKWTQTVKGQSVVELIAACQVCELPLQLLVTDGEKSHILELSGAKIIVWKDLDCETALRHIAKGLVSKVSQDVDENKVFLLSKDLLKQATVKKSQGLASINEGNEMQNAPSNLQEQLDSILPWFESKGDQLEVALELIHGYVRHQEGSFNEVPLEIQSMYA